MNGMESDSSTTGTRPLNEETLLGGVTNPLVDHYRLPQAPAELRTPKQLSAEAGYFRFGGECICFGSSSIGYRSASPTGSLYDALQDVRIEPGVCSLPFDAATIVDQLRLERYAGLAGRPDAGGRRWVRSAYYVLRPLLPVKVRKFLQRFALKDWTSIAFPAWPVDRTVDRLFESLLALSMKAGEVDRLPFIWFWPEGYSSCAIMTHDVETRTGLDFCPAMMDIEDSFQIKASFQLIPEKRYRIPEAQLNEIRARGFEVNVHDLNHDGHLFDDHDEFVKRAARINRYGREFGARGFRSAVLYRNLDWYSSLNFSYDMSVPNVAHLDPQRGGCCTVTPYFIGKILEIPLTGTQDYSLFHILNDYSIDLWTRQIRLIQEANGAVSFNIHPDYVIPERARKTYLALLEHLARLRAENRTWFALPGEVDRWWRARSQMRLVRENGGWAIAGEGRERARLAYANLEDGSVTYTLEPAKASPVAHTAL